MKKTLRQITKISVDPDKLRALCITTKGTNIAFDISLSDNPKYLKLVNEFSNEVLEILEEELE